MKRLLAALLVLGSFCPSAFAQALPPKPFFGGGFGLTFVGGDSLVALSFQGGAADLLGPLGVRGNFDIGISGSYFEFGLDLFGTFPAEGLSPYVGGGVGVLSGGGTFFNLHGTAGLELLFERIGLFGEVQPKFFITANQFGAALRFGANYRFD
jgi:hypothetical protein